MNRITVFTPTYNRASILGKCYESLRAQSCKDFVWLIVDDGSTDDTRKLVEAWQTRENGFEIRYVYKPNGGLASAYNTALEHMDTPLSVCIDSDDAMPGDGIEIILRAWEELEGMPGSERVAGLVGLDFAPDGTLIGKPLPKTKYINAATLLCTQGMGDKKYVIRTDLWRQVAPIPLYGDEKDMNPHYIVLRLSGAYVFRTLPRCLCRVEYRSDGMSARIFHQYVESPQSFAELRRVILETPGLTLRYRFRTAAHYVAACRPAGLKHPVRRSPAPGLTLVAWPVGVLLRRYILRKARERAPSC